MKARTLIEVIASLLIVVFLYAATTQLISHTPLQLQIERSLHNAVLATITAWLLPGIQLTLSFLLWKPATRLAGFIGSFTMMSCYTVYLIMMGPGAFKTPCHCGELWQQATLELNILTNLFIILFTGTAIIITGRFKTDSPRFS